MIDWVTPVASSTATAVSAMVEKRPTTPTSSRVFSGPSTLAVAAGSAEEDRRQATEPDREREHVGEVHTQREPGRVGDAGVAGERGREGEKAETEADRDDGERILQARPARHQEHREQRQVECAQRPDRAEAGLELIADHPRPQGVPEARAEADRGLQRDSGERGDEAEREPADQQSPQSGIEAGARRGDGRARRQNRRAPATRRRRGRSPRRSRAQSTRRSPPGRRRAPRR